MTRYFKKIGYDKPVLWDKEERIKYINILDAVMAHLYGINKEEFEYLISRFKLLEKQELKMYGIFLTKKMALNYYDKIKLVDENE